jgi:hypothetical protein
MRKKFFVVTATLGLTACVDNNKSLNLTAPQDLEQYLRPSHQQRRELALRAIGPVRCC